MTIAEIKKKLEKNLSPKRFAHSVNVMDTAVKLAGTYGADAVKCKIAGLLHDCARDFKGERLFELCAGYGLELDEVMKRRPEIIHGPLGVYVAQEHYEIDDFQVLDAIRYHTVGAPGMDLIAKIIFISDYIEPLRKFTGVEELRKEAFKNLDNSLVLGINNTIEYILTGNGLLHPGTVNTRNWLLLNQNKNESGE